MNTEDDPFASDTSASESDILHIVPVPTESLPPRPLLREDVLARLRDAIIDGTLAPDEQLRDTEIATWLGVSRTPVREALLELARAGLVRATPGRSTRETHPESAPPTNAPAGIAAKRTASARPPSSGPPKSR